MDSSSDSEMIWRLWSKKRSRSNKRLKEDDDLGNLTHNKKEKAENLSRPVICNGAKVNSASCNCALARAQKLQANLSLEFPSCVKLVTQSHVPGGKEQYLVYIVRSCRPEKVDGAIRNPEKDVLIGTEARTSMAAKEDYRDQEDTTEKTKYLTTPSPHRVNLCSEASGGIRFSASVVKFQDMKRFEDFKIYVDGLILDSELPVHAKMKYYELCCSQKLFLHDRLMTGLGSKLVTGIISETSNIADGIKSTCLAASLHNLESWDRTLKSFEDLGMSVGFLRRRIDKLVKISRKYQTINESKSAKFARVEEKKRALAEEVSTMEALRKSIAAHKELIKSLEAKIDGIEGKNAGLGFEFNKIATAPW